MPRGRKPMDEEYGAMDPSTRQVLRKKYLSECEQLVERLAVYCESQNNSYELPSELDKLLDTAERLVKNRHRKTATEVIEKRESRKKAQAEKKRQAHEQWLARKKIRESRKNPGS